MSVASEVDCRAAAYLFRMHAEGRLPGEDAAVLEGHMAACAKCRKAHQKETAYVRLLEGVFAQRQMPGRFMSASPALLEPTKISEIVEPDVETAELPEDRAGAADGHGADPVSDPAVGLSSGNEVGEAHGGEAEGAGERAPWLLRLAACELSWWGISVLFHGLVILLMTLVSWVLTEPDFVDASGLVVTTSLERRTDPTAKYLSDSKFVGEREAKATDPTSNTPCDIEVSPEILAKAELGDHFETINPERPDTHSAFGNPDAHMFHSAGGSDDKAGGGGTGGSTLDEVIGVGGSGSPGTGGGWGGGTGKGIGNDVGDGKGSFGHRTGGGRKLMVMRHGGSSGTERGVRLALEWLARHQEEDGRWRAGIGQQDVHDAFKDYDVAMTGLALLAFLGAGHTEKVGQYRANVQRGVYWLISKQAEDGSWRGTLSPQRFMYEQGIASLALAEAYGMGRLPDTGRAAQKAIDFVQQAQHEYAAWNYTPSRNTNDRNDTSVSGWSVMALKSAKIAGLKVDSLAFQGAIAWLDAGQKIPKDVAQATSDFEGGEMAYAGTVKGEGLAYHGIAMTGAGALMRQFLGFKRDFPGVLGPANLMLKDLPVWRPGGHYEGPGNMYYWYYATLVMFQMGGEHWKAWNEAMKPMLLTNQRRGGDEDGSWDPMPGGYVTWGGRVMSTALCCLCLEVYYRYLPVYR